jgi:tetratricopeptide (TPR) repeat protein
MVLTTSQISLWRSSVSLFEHAVEVIPNIWRIQGNLGQALLDEGRVDEAISNFQMVLLIAPSHDEALAYKAFAINGLGMANERQGKKDKAMEQFLEAIRIYPELVVANNNLGEKLSRQGRHEEAIYYFQQAVKHRPTSAVAHQNLARSLTALGMSPSLRSLSFSP